MHVSTEDGEVPTLMKLACRVLDTAYQSRGDALLTDLDAQFAALIDTDAVIPSPQEMWEIELACV